MQKRFWNTWALNKMSKKNKMRRYYKMSMKK